MTSFLSHSELKEIGLKSIGSDVKISRNAKFYNSGGISIGDNVRIDDFCILSGTVTLGSNIHISAYVALYGRGSIILEDYTTMSPKSIIFSQSSDWSGDYFVGVMLPDEYIKADAGPVIMKRFSALGAGSIVLPRVIINEGAGVGAMSFVKKSIPEWEIWAGNPVRFIKKRNRNIINLEKQFKNV